MGGKRNLFINRELSWLEFNQHVLDESLDPDVPLLERLNFLGITASNLDEFFMVRVGGLQLLVEGKSSKTDTSGLTPTEQLQTVTARTRRMIQDQYDCYLKILEPELIQAGIHRVRPDHVNEAQRQLLERFSG